MVRKLAEENSGDSNAPTGGIPEKEPHMNSDGVGGGEVDGPTTEGTNQGTLWKEDAKKLLVASSSSNSEQIRETVLFSPGFSSAVAKAGWDAETLLMAALSRSPIDSGSGVQDFQDAFQVSRADDRKRDKHTPLSSARRHRRVRLENKNGSPLGRLPMKPLTLLSDNELENVSPANKSCLVSVAEGKENCYHNALTCKKGDTDVKGKQKERTPTKPPCLDQLREELSCAVCLDICFEPSTISCGHSFCGTCLQSVLQKCGPRCPKCRQPLRTEALRDSRINTVLWNTIQILFPKESAARIKDNQKSLAEEAAKRASLVEHHSTRYLGTRPSRMEPWRSSAFNSVRRTSVMGNLRTSFQAASELLMPSNRERDDDNGRSQQQRDPPTGINSEDRERTGSSQTRRTQTQAQVTQEQVDAALAARLQRAELNAASDTEALRIIEEVRQVSEIPPSHPTIRSRTSTVARTATVASAALNLRTVAQRATRQRRVRTRS